MGGFGGGKPDTSAAEESLRMQREETARARAKAEEEKKQLAEQMSSAKRARLRGGKRTLLSESRLIPEMGVEDEDQTLGA